MMDEAQHMYPVQFLEGLNENEEPATGRFLTWEESGIAIPYTPGITYSLSRIEIYGVPHNLEAPREHHLHLHTDFKDMPSRNTIASGKLIVPRGNSGQWLQIMMEEAIIVIARRKYWFTLAGYPLSFSIGLAQDGEDLGLRTGTNENWAPSSLGKHKCMLRFYGRIVPAAVPLATKEEPYPARSLRRIERCLVEMVKLMKEQKELLVRGDEDERVASSRGQKPLRDKTRQQDLSYTAGDTLFKE